MDEFDAAERRAAYAERLLHLTARIVATVRDDDPAVTAQLIAHALAVPAPAGVNPTYALITVLAAQVPVDETTSTLLSWVDDSTHLPPPPSRDVFALVQDVVNGRRSVLDLPEKLRSAPIEILRGQRKTYEEIASIVGCSTSQAHRIGQASERAARATA